MNYLESALAFMNAVSAGGHPYSARMISSGRHFTHVVEAGQNQRETLVFLHGFPSFWHCWWHQLEAFRKDYHVVAIDGLGCGGSDKPIGDGNYAIPELLDWLEAALSAISPADDVVLIGHDWGGMLAWEYALAHRPGIKALIVASCASHSAMIDALLHDPVQREKSSYIQRLTSIDVLGEGAQAAPGHLFEACYRDVINRGSLPTAQEQIFRHALSDRLSLDCGLAWYRANLDMTTISHDPSRFASSQARRSRVPVGYIFGEDDPILGRVLLRQIGVDPDVTNMQVIERCGHWAPFERPNAFNRALSACLAGI